MKHLGSRSWPTSAALSDRGRGYPGCTTRVHHVIAKQFNLSQQVHNEPRDERNRQYVLWRMQTKGRCFRIGSDAAAPVVTTKLTPSRHVLRHAGQARSNASPLRWPCWTATAHARSEHMHATAQHARRQGRPGRTASASARQR